MSYASFGQAGERPDNDRSLAPYLTVLGAGGPEGTERVPLKETSADVSIAGVIARVQVHQLFENTGRAHRGGLRVPGVDARRGARHAHEDRPARDRGEDRSQGRRRARATRRARREGKRASLLEQERPTCSR